MFIPIITVFSDVIRLFTFQPPRAEGNTPFRRPCPEADCAPVETECDRPAAKQPAPRHARSVGPRFCLPDKAPPLPEGKALARG